MAEIHCHGAPVVIDYLSSALRELGAEPAPAGEFARRAMQNGKLDLIGAEALDSILQAQNWAQLKLAQGQSGLARLNALESIVQL